MLLCLEKLMTSVQTFGDFGCGSGYSFVKSRCFLSVVIIRSIHKARALPVFGLRNIYYMWFQIFLQFNVIEIYIFLLKHLNKLVTINHREVFFSKTKIRSKIELFWFVNNKFF